nr:hypothetical protein CFP56_51944 [Quercus suber]
MGRKRRLQFIEPGESFSHVGSNEVPSRQQAPPADDDRRQSQGSDDETQPPARIPLAEQRKWVLSRIGKLWRSHKSELKEKHCNTNTTKEDLLQQLLPEVDDTQFHGLVEYWFSDDFKELSKDNKKRHGKQTEVHTLGSRSLARTADIIAKEKGRQLERGEMYEVAYSHRDGTAVNATAGANIAKMKELMTKGSQLQGNDIEAGILWQPDDAFGQVIGAERRGCVRGVGFGRTPSGNRARSVDDSTPPPTSIAIDQRVIELSTQVEEMKEKCNRYEAEMRLMRRVLTSLFPSVIEDENQEL